MVAGQIGILDCANVTMAHFRQFNPTFIKKITIMSQEASPTRQKGFHFINTPMGFETVFNVFKSFINDKNKTKVNFKINFRRILLIKIQTFMVILNFSALRPRK